MYVAGYRQKAEIYLTYFVDVFSRYFILIHFAFMVD